MRTTPTSSLFSTVRDGLDAYWDSPSEYHSALDALEAELAAALNRGDYWRDSNDLTGQKLVAAEAERDEIRSLLLKATDDRSTKHPEAGSSGEGWRQLDCGCWERHVHGDIVTSSVKPWLLVAPCQQHSRASS